MVKAGRIRSNSRCDRCEIRRDLCFCDKIPEIFLPTKVTIIMHKCEQYLPSNTAKLAHMILKNSELRIRGEREESMKTDDLVTSEYTSLFLFPYEDAVELTSDLVKGPVKLIVPDGSWGQAKRVFRRIPELKDVARVKLPYISPSEYVLRTEHKSEHMSTYEAIAYALSIFHGKHVLREMLPVFREKMSRTLISKGLPT